MSKTKAKSRKPSSLTISVPGTDMSLSRKVPVSETVTGTSAEVVEGPPQVGGDMDNFEKSYPCSEPAGSDPELNQIPKLTWG